jgi:hypothetical protein
MTRMLTWRRCPGRLRPSSAAAVASLGAGRGLGPWLTAVDVRPRPRCARGFRSRTSSLHQVSLGLCEGELGTWGDPRVNDGGACASPHSKPLAENPRARCGRSRCRREALAVPARGARGAGERRTWCRRGALRGSSHCCGAGLCPLRPNPESVGKNFRRMSQVLHRGGLLFPHRQPGSGLARDPKVGRTRKNTEQPLTDPMESENLPNTEHPSEQTPSLRR